jgi:hypothetical protein
MTTIDQDEIDYIDGDVENGPRYDMFGGEPLTRAEVINRYGVDPEGDQADMDENADPRIGTDKETTTSLLYDMVTHAFGDLQRAILNQVHFRVTDWNVAYDITDEIWTTVPELNEIGPLADRVKEAIVVQFEKAGYLVQRDA